LGFRHKYLVFMSLLYYNRYIMKRSGIKLNTSIRIDPDILHQARIGAVTDRMTLGQWLEVAIIEKIERDKGEEQVPTKHS